MSGWDWVLFVGPFVALLLLAVVAFVMAWLEKRGVVGTSWRDRLASIGDFFQWFP